MRKKSVVSGIRHRRSITPSTASPIPLLSATNDDHNATVYNSNSDGDDNHHTHTPFPDSVPETVPVDSLDDNICITCNKLGGELLVCSQTDCPVSVHVTCIGSEPKFDDSGNFFCPYCAYKRALKKTRELREKAVLAKKALSSFLDKHQTVHKDKEEQPVEPEPETVQDHVNRNEPEANEPEVDEPKVSHSEEESNNDKENDEEKVSVSGSSVSETKDSDYEVSVAEKKVRASVKRKAAPVKKALLRERKNGGGGGSSSGGDDIDEEEVTSSRTSSLRKRVWVIHQPEVQWMWNLIIHVFVDLFNFSLISHVNTN